MLPDMRPGPQCRAAEPSTLGGSRPEQVVVQAGQVVEVVEQAEQVVEQAEQVTVQAELAVVQDSAARRRRKGIHQPQPQQQQDYSESGKSCGDE